MTFSNFMNSQQINLDDLIIRIREQGNRLTPQRLAVLKTLIGNKEHLSAEDVYERVRKEFPMIGLATVYKTVNTLKAIGEVSEINMKDGGSRIDGYSAVPHPHIICLKCEEVIDVEIDGLEVLRDSIKDTHQYQIKNFRLDFFGICPKCQAVLEK